MIKEQLEVYFKKYYSLVYRVAFTHVKANSDAEDVAQEVFIRLMRYTPKFENEEHEKAWMLRTTINLCHDLSKSKWHGIVLGIERIPEAEKQYLTVPFVEEDDILWAILELRERYRNPLYLFYYEDYSIKEISQVENIPENTVKTYLKRGREELKRLLVNK